jgi:hypothetical protein
MMVSDACDLVTGQTHQGPRPSSLDKHCNEQQRTADMYCWLNREIELVSGALDSHSDSCSLGVFMFAVTVFLLPIFELL